MVQLFVTVTNAAAKNMEDVYGLLANRTVLKNLADLDGCLLANRTVLKNLADLDGCLLSFESFSTAWLTAIQDLKLRGSFDLKSTLQGINMRPVTEHARSAFNEEELEKLMVPGGASHLPASSVAKTGGDDDHDDKRESIFQWNHLLAFGQGEDEMSCHKLLEAQLDLQRQLLAFANKLEAPWHERLTIHMVAPDQDATEKAGKSTSYDLLLHVPQKEELVQSPRDEKMMMYKIPENFKLAFWGSVGHWSYVCLFVYPSVGLFFVRCYLLSLLVSLLSFCHFVCQSVRYLSLFFLSFVICHFV